MASTHNIHARREGQGVPILIIHGWTLNGDVEAVDLEPILSKTKLELERIYIDLPGMGKSPLAGAKNLEAMLSRVSQFIDEEILPSRFLVAGSSAGGYLARAVAHKYAKHIDGLMLRVTVFDPYRPNRDLDDFRVLVSSPQYAQDLTDTNTDDLDDIPVQTLEYLKLRNAKYKIFEDALKATDIQALKTIHDSDTTYRLTSPLHTAGDVFEKPVLILAGRQDTVVGYRDAIKLLEAYPRATFVALDRATHALPIDETDLYQSLVTDWVMRSAEIIKHG